MKRLTLMALAIASAVAAPAGATLFATFTPIDNGPNVLYSAGAVSGTGSNVTFRFTGQNGGAPSDFTSLLTLSALIGNPAIAGDTAIAPLTGGRIAFTTANAVSYGNRSGTNLLTATFSGGALTADVPGTTATYAITDPRRSITFTSDFIDFSRSTTRDLAFAINAIVPMIDETTFNGGFFLGSMSGNFGADAFDSSPLPAVPEPATWAMLLLGFGLTGVAARRHRIRVRHVAA